MRTVPALTFATLLTTPSSMACSLKPVLAASLALAALAFTVNIAAATRPLEHPKSTTVVATRAAPLAAVEEDNATLTTCWESLVELQSCSNEVILFFLNGETNLGPDCCQAIRIIEHHCWPSMLTSLGYNSEESDILRGYCDASESGVHLSPPPPDHLFREPKVDVNQSLPSP